jgi:hypothetical protein
MPAQFTFYSDKSSEVLLSTSVSGPTTTSVVSANILASASASASLIGSALVTKTNTIDGSGNVWAIFNWQFQFNSGNTLSVPADQLVVTFSFNNDTTSGSNPTESIPTGQTSVTVTGSIQNYSQGAYQNQFGYVTKVKSATTNFRQYNVFFPQLVANYTNVFNSLPQPNVAPLS